MLLQKVQMQHLHLTPQRFPAVTTFPRAGPWVLHQGLHTQTQYTFTPFVSILHYKRCRNHIPNPLHTPSILVPSFPVLPSSLSPSRDLCCQVGYHTGSQPPHKLWPNPCLPATTGTAQGKNSPVLTSSHLMKRSPLHRYSFTSVGFRTGFSTDMVLLMCSSATRSKSSCTVHFSLGPSPLSLPLTWQGVLPWPPLASESKQPLISQPNLGGAGTGRRGAMNLHCKSTAPQASRASPKVTRRKAADGGRARGLKRPLSLREGSTPWSCAGEAPGSVNFRNSTSLNALLQLCQNRSNCFSSCGYGAAQLWLQVDCPLLAIGQMSQETSSFLALDRFHFWGHSLHCPVLNSFPFSYGLF